MTIIMGGCQYCKRNSEWLAGQNEIVFITSVQTKKHKIESNLAWPVPMHYKFTNPRYIW